MPERIDYRRLTCGMDLAVMPMPERPIVAVAIRLLAGYAFEQPEHLGVAHVCDEAIGKGTAKRDGRALNDAFDEIGATHGSYAGRESFGFSCLCLPEFVPQVIDLLAEMIRTPSFPQEACEVAVELTRQSLAALNDEPQDLVKKLLHRQAYGEPLGRHPLGENETLDRIGREQIVDHWCRFFRGPNMQCSITGAVEPDLAADLLDRAFDAFVPDPQTAGAAGSRPVPPPLRFTPGRRHHDKDLEQEYVALCFPGSAVTDVDFPVEQVLVGVLAGGMSGRLFTEVREKQGLVYWVGAWSDHPRGAGVIHLGASTTAQRVDQTYTTLLREINRLSEDLTDAEVQRVITGIVAQAQTRGDVSRARATRLADDLFYYDRPIPIEEKLARIEAVTVNDIRQYLEAHPRDRLSVVTLGPRELEESP
jgi:predicted Zn-dependent peptidase